MENLPLSLKEPILQILRKLEVYVYGSKQHKSNNKVIEIICNDVNFVTMKKEYSNSIMFYLQEHGLNFSVESRLKSVEARQKDEELSKSPHLDPIDRFIPDPYEKVGVIKGENIVAIKTKIEQLIFELENQKQMRPKHGLMKEQVIKNIEVLEDKDERKKITIFINADYENQKDFSRKKYWGSIYRLAVDQFISYDKGIFDYFNFNEKNPLYGEGEFKITKILKIDDKFIVPNIEIKLITQKAVTRRKVA